MYKSIFLYNACGGIFDSNLYRYQRHTYMTIVTFTLLVISMKIVLNETGNNLTTTQQQVGWVLACHIIYSNCYPVGHKY